ncbi:centrosomal protein of 128 kDa isoform X2 [Oryzias melastigma]|uniref:centrosomal protein of 128 kDa isoform X2 n=1 Tax=Oryzias melastigma TaxID=30732 RepID=UPI000CF7E61E|nr:centrosomal protein of 128 kDa isoform X2 [Oryzias melastigma]
METSSESESLGRSRGPGRSRGRRTERSSGSGSDVRAADISQKISTLANTLQDTSRNLTKVDRMLGQYQGHTDDQAEAMALLRENLEESINQLQTKRLSRVNGVCSPSASTLQTSDLEVHSESGQRFYPTSPLRDNRHLPGRRRRSQSANVRFKDSGVPTEEIHAFHQSLRDLCSDHQRLSDDLDREILRRNRADIDTRRAMESLTEHMTASQRLDSVPRRVDRRLQELEREMLRGEQERRPEQREAAPDGLQEALGRRQVQSREDEATTARLLQAEREKYRMEQELEKVRSLLQQSEDRRESLMKQVEDARGELLQRRAERPEAARPRLETPPLGAQLHTARFDHDVGKDRADLEKELLELRAQVQTASVLGEVEELKRALDCKEKERLQLSLQVKELSSDFARQEEQQRRMLEQLRELQSRGLTEKRQMEALLQESAKSRDDLKSRAQDAVRQWRAKCRRLQKEVEEAAKQKESSHAQLKALSQQSESACRELTEVLGRLAQRDEELHRREVELMEARQRLLTLEQETREVKEASAALEQEVLRHAAVQSRLKEENQTLEDRLEAQTRRSQRDQDRQAELQASLKQATAANAQLLERLAEEQSAVKELKRRNSDLEAKLTALQVERAALGQQLQLEREAHRKDLESVEDGVKKERRAQEVLKLCRQERDELKEQLRGVQADAASDKELRDALQIKLDRMKDECDKLAAQLSVEEESRSLLQRKQQLLKQQLEDRAVSGKQTRESERLENKMLQIEADQEAVLTSLGEELDAACRILAKNEEKLQAIYQRPGLVRDPHRWLAETKTKLRWLCEEVREHDAKAQRWRKQHQQTKDQLKALRQSRDAEQAVLLQRLHQQEKLLEAFSAEKKELLEKSRRKEDEARSLQDRVWHLEKQTRVNPDHLESLQEDSFLIERFKDLEASPQKELVEKRYSKHSEVVRDLQEQLDESKRRMQEYKEEKLDATSRSLRLAALSSSIKTARSDSH